MAYTYEEALHIRKVEHENAMEFEKLRHKHVMEEINAGWSGPNRAKGSIKSVK